MTDADARAGADAAAHALGAALAPGAAPRRFVAGSVPVFALGDDLVLKLFPAAERAHFDTERAALDRAAGALPIPTPRIVAAGAHGDWWYVAMTRLRGRPLEDAWPEIEPTARRTLMQEVGAALAALHALPTHDLAPLAVDWPNFMAEQRAACRARQAAKGLDARRVEQIEPFLSRWAPLDDGRRAVLHTEIMADHLLVERRGTGWGIGGLVDFEPAMIGAPEYEFAAVGVFLTRGAPDLLRAVLAGYGRPPDEGFPMRVMSYLLLHRYSNLRWYLEHLGAAPSDDLEGLARRWFGT